MNGELSVLNREGDTKIIWDSNNDDEVEAARKTFDGLKKKGFMAYKAIGKDGRKGDIIKDFDPEAERIIMVPRMVGGQYVYNITTL